ncbi:MAG: SRPBCC family protein [Thermoanaerobaculia bacterium]
MIHDASRALDVESEPPVRIQETFDSPRERVFDAWVRRDLLERWFAPHGCTLHIARLDARTGGGYHWCVRNPAFGDCWTIGSYIEVVRPERIVFTSVIADAAGQPATPESQGHDPAWPAETVVHVRFDERGARTLVTLEQSVSEALAKRTGAHPSWMEMFDRLSRLVAGGSE